MSRMAAMRLLSRSPLPWFLPTFCLLAPAAPAPGHPIESDNHDRTIAVRVGAEAKTGQVVVRVAYRVEVAENRAIRADLPAVRKKLDLSDFRNQPNRFYREFTRLYAPVLAANLTAKVDGRPMRFTPVEHRHALKDEQGRALGHLRWDFLFEARARVRPCREHRFECFDGNYQEFYTGQILLSFADRPPLRVVKQTAPSKALQERPETDRDPEDEKKLRTVTAAFT